MLSAWADADGQCSLAVPNDRGTCPAATLRYPARGRRKAKARAHLWTEPRAFCVLARMRARLPCLYACTARRCPVLGAGGMKTGEESYRLYSCGRCARQVRICRDCDRGNRYCAGECAAVRRRESLQRAGARYQCSHRGASRHAARQSAWRQRRPSRVVLPGADPPGRSLFRRPRPRSATRRPNALRPRPLFAERAHRRRHLTGPDDGDAVRRHVVAPAVLLAVIADLRAGLDHVVGCR